ncbi:MAG: T9SS type A sorting domain-containing protein [Candidatus Eisenbacteria bacterium]|nr:T9SS type A sorting domain-containing protein [Candidatus Latescibacterota bacterium]MBD3302765.1 T9SS type A sorting domain-containing protein [Candidatus Eisenbacteria bacterium]
MRTLLRLTLPLVAGLILAGGTAEADDTIFDIQLGVYPEGTTVTIEDVVVTAVGRFGFFIQEPDPDDTFGRQWSGIWVYTNDIPEPRRGDLVRVTGEYVEYFGMSEINVYDSASGEVTVLDQGTVPDPVDVTIPEVNTEGPLAEAYESVLLRVDREDDTLYSYPPDQYMEWFLKRAPGQDSLKMESWSALPGGDFEYDVPDSGTVLSYAQGILTYSFDEFKLAPRNCDEDLGTACKPRLRGSYAMSSTQVGVQFGVPVDEASAENIDNYELVSGLSVLSAELDETNAKRVYLTTEDLGNGEEEELIASGVLSQEGVPMSGPESAPFRTGFTPIREIQYVSNPQNTDISPLVEEIVTIQGRVTGLDGGNYYYLQDDDGGAWDGLYVRVAKSTPLEIGREVRVTGRVREYFGMTQLSYASGHDFYRDRGFTSPVTTNTVTASDIPYRDVARTAEPWEDCLVRLEEGELDSLDGVVGPAFDEWLLFQDGDPDTAKMDYFELNGEKGYAACIGDVVNVTGLLGYDFSQYSIWPRWGRGIDIEVVYDNPDCSPAGVEDLGTTGLSPNLRTAPNPFNPRATIRFELPAQQTVRLEILDPSGRVVRTLLDGETRVPGTQQVVWDGSDDAGRPAGTGTYFVRLQTERGAIARKMILLK